MKFINKYTIPSIHRAARLFLVTACCMAFTFRASPQQYVSEQIDSLLTELETASTSRKITILNDLSKLHWEISLDKSIEYAENAMEIARENKNQNGIAESFNRIGNAYSALEVYDQALENYEEARMVWVALQNYKGLARVLGNLGICYFNTGEKEKSRVSFEEQLKIAREIQDDSLLAFGYHNLGEFHARTENFIQAFDLLDSAAFYYEKAGNMVKSIEVLNILGDAYLSYGNRAEALMVYNRSRKKCIELSTPADLAEIDYRMGKIYLSAKEYDKAYDFFMQSLKNAEESGVKTVIRDIYNSLSKYHLQTGDTRKAYSYRKLCSELTDSLSALLLEEKLNKLQIQYDIKNKDQELQYLRKTEEIEELQMQKDRYFRNFMIILVSVLVVATIGSMYNLWQKRKSTSILEKQKQLQEETNLQLIDSQETQQQINLTKNKFLAIISQDLISPFKSLLEHTETMEKRSTSPSRRDVKKYSGIIYHSAKNLYQMLENLLQWSRNQRGKIEYHPEYFDLSKMINTLTSLMEISARKKNIELNLDLDEAIIVFADENHVNDIMRNLMNNAIKFTNVNGRINISTCEKNGYIEVSVKDNGIGISIEDMDKLFRLDSHVTRRGTANEMGTGLGLIIVKDLVEKNGGNIVAESEEGKGSTFAFTLPKKP